MAPFHNPFKHGVRSPKQSPRISTVKSPQVGQEQVDGYFKGAPRLVSPQEDYKDSSKGRKPIGVLKKLIPTSPLPAEPIRSKKDASSPPAAQPRSPTKLSKGRRGSGAAPSAGNGNSSHGKTGLASLGFRRPSLPLGMGALSFRRSSVAQDGPESDAPPPVPDVSKWRGVRRKSSTREATPLPSVLEGLGIDVENTPRVEQAGSLPPRIPTPLPPSPKEDGHAYFDLTSSPSTGTYSPPKTHNLVPLDPAPVRSRSPAGGSTAPSATSRRSQAPSARHYPLPHSDAESRSFTISRPSSADSNRPRSSVGLYASVESTSPVRERDPELIISSAFAPPVPIKTNRLKPLTLNPNSSTASNRLSHHDDGPRTSPLRSNPVTPASRRGSASSAIPLAPVGVRRVINDEGGPRTKRNTMIMSSSSKRNTFVDPELINRPLPQPAEMFTLRPTVSQATQTPPQWLLLGATSPPLPPPPHGERRSMGSFSQFQGRPARPISGSPGSVYPPSPSIYSTNGFYSGDATPSRRTSALDADAYWDDGLIPDEAPDTPVTIATAFRRNSPPISELQSSQPPVLITLPGSTPPRAPLDSPDERDESPRTPTPATTASMDYPVSQPILYSSSVDEVVPPHHQFFRSTSKGPTPPATLTSSLGPPLASPKRRGSAWELPSQESASSIANKIRRPSLTTPVYTPIASTVRSTLAPPAAAALERSSSAPSAPMSPIPDSPELSPTPSPPTAPASSFSEVEPEIPAAVPRRRASQPHLKVDYHEQARLRAQKGRSFFLVQALNNPTKAKEQIESQSYDSGDDSDDSIGDSLFYASPKVGRK